MWEGTRTIPSKRNPFSPYSLSFWLPSLFTPLGELESDQTFPAVPAKSYCLHRVCFLISCACFKKDLLLIALKFSLPLNFYVSKTRLKQKQMKKIPFSSIKRHRGLFNMNFYQNCTILLQLQRALVLPNCSFNINYNKLETFSGLGSVGGDILALQKEKASGWSCY